MFSNLIKQVQAQKSGVAAPNVPSATGMGGMMGSMVSRVNSMRFPTVSGTPTGFGKVLQDMKKGPTV